jgi:hypothetical protein
MKFMLHFNLLVLPVFTKAVADRATDRGDNHESVRLVQSPAWHGSEGVIDGLS